MKKISIGLDLGVASVGWAVLDVTDELKVNILDHGVKLFEQSKKAEDRRGHRALRRRYKRANHRIERFENLLKDNEIEYKMSTDNNLLDKRIVGLTQKIEIQDIMNILRSLLKRRGYQPFADDTRENDYKNKYPDLIACEIQKIILDEVGHYRGLEFPFLVSDFEIEIKLLLKNQSKFHDKINVNFENKYLEIFKSRRKFWEGPGGAEYSQITPFGRYKTKEDVERAKSDPSYNQFLYENLIKNCSIYVGEKSVNVENYYAQYFNLFNDLVNIRISSNEHFENKYLVPIDNIGEYFKFSLLGIQKLIDAVIFAKQHGKTGFAKIFKDTVNVDIEDMKGYRVNAKGDIELTSFSLVREFLKVAKDLNYDFDIKNDKDITKYNLISKMITISPASNLTEMIELNRENMNLNKYDEKIISLKNVQNKATQQYHSYSEKALLKYIDLMETSVSNSMTVSREYADIISETVTKNKLNNYFKDATSTKMSNKFIDDLVASPQVKKTLRKSIKTVNEIIEQYCKKDGYEIEFISVESNAELLNEKKQDEYKENMAGNYRKREKLIKMGLSEVDIIKTLLLEEVNHCCMYCAKHITIETMEIEHIIPESISADDSYSNKCASCRECNQAKGNKTSYEFMSSRGNFEVFEKKVNKISDKLITYDKKRNLLNRENVSKYQKKFINRNLRDTSYATKEMLSQLKLYSTALSKIHEIETSFKVVSMPPKITGKIRSRFPKDRSTDFHHAFDAAVCAYYPLTYLGRISVKLNNDLSAFWLQDNYIGKFNDEQLKLPFESNFVKQLTEINQSNTRFHFSVRTNVNKQLANADIKKVISSETKKGLEYKKIEYISNIYENDTKAIGKMLTDEKSSKVLGLKYNDVETFELLKKIYIEYKDQKFKNQDGKEVKCNPFILYCIEQHELATMSEFNYRIHGIRPVSKKGKVRPIIKKLKYASKASSPYIIRKQSININVKNKIMLDSLAQAYTEVYKNLDDGGYLFLPVASISCDLNTGKVKPNDSYYIENKEKFIGNKNVEFCFKVNTNEYIRGVHKNGEIVEGLYKYFHIGTIQLELKTKKTIGKSFRKIEKVEVYGLGIKGMDLSR